MPLHFFEWNWKLRTKQSVHAVQLQIQCTCTEEKKTKISFSTLLCHAFNGDAGNTGVMLWAFSRCSQTGWNLYRRMEEMLLCPCFPSLFAQGVQKLIPVQLNLEQPQNSSNWCQGEGLSVHQFHSFLWQLCSLHCCREKPAPVEAIRGKREGIPSFYWPFLLCQDRGINWAQKTAGSSSVSPDVCRVKWCKSRAYQEYCCSYTLNLQKTSTLKINLRTLLFLCNSALQWSLCNGGLCSAHMCSYAQAECHELRMERKPCLWISWLLLVCVINSTLFKSRVLCLILSNASSSMPSL